jgi:hypothetical protein
MQQLLTQLHHLSCSMLLAVPMLLPPRGRALNLQDELRVLPIAHESSIAITRFGMPTAIEQLSCLLTIRRVCVGAPPCAPRRQSWQPTTLLRRATPPRSG